MPGDVLDQRAVEGVQRRVEGLQGAEGGQVDAGDRAVEEPGVTCIDLVNSITVSTASLIPSPEFTFDSTQVFNTSGDDNTLVEWNSAAAQCPAGTMQVTTALQRFSAGALIGNELQPQAFVFVVP